MCLVKNVGKTFFCIKILFCELWYTVCKCDLCKNYIYTYRLFVILNTKVLNKFEGSLFCEISKCRTTYLCTTPSTSRHSAGAILVRPYKRAIRCFTQKIIVQYTSALRPQVFKYNLWTFKSLHIKTF